MLGTGGSDGVVRMWSTVSGRLLWRQRVLSGPDEHLQLRFSPDGSLLAVVEWKKKLCALEVQSGQIVTEPVQFVVGQTFADWTELPGQL